jgi:uncharacterized membrane protein
MIWIANAAGLVWRPVHPTPTVGFRVLICVIVAGISGTVTVSRGIACVHTAPAAIALILLNLA